ncbi:hypothetical protein T440DRAFT_134760 [Plenodomus tracheiphilus IPT5]|uniref:Transmembrane protein n=1 Tax=Plenodomus tracheiphilus IPT5 TaxID=1408161 RepID=A0A6A7B243_9PLEO|nr:hypothetical protein T440DRAFT_134760 [Plenodomus tracheiphilus IPT5]
MVEREEKNRVDKRLHRFSFSPSVCLSVFFLHRGCYHRTLCAQSLFSTTASGFLGLAFMLRWLLKSHIPCRWTEMVLHGRST